MTDYLTPEEVEEIRQCRLIIRECNFRLAEARRRIRTIEQRRSNRRRSDEKNPR